jgi:putative ABC transport system permease protein
VTGGRWHGASKAAEFSVEQGIADTLHLKLGDRLQYNIAGQLIAAPITSLRKLDWDSMRVNFFVMAPPGLLDAAPASYITSFHLPPARAALTTDLVRAFPNLTVIDIAAVMRQLDAMLGQIVQAISLVFGFAMLAGMAVLYAALQAGSDERQHELAVLRALGARHRQLRRALLAEFLMLGATAGLLAGLAAGLIGWGLARFAFQLDYVPSPHWLLVGLLAGSGIVASVGWLGSAHLLRDPVMPALRA